MRLLLPIILLLAAAGLISCDRNERPQERVFRFINRGDIFTLDLNQMSYAQDFRLTYAMREGLYSPVGPEFQPIPTGAERCEISPDGKVYTFHLRKSAKWSNGDPVVAGDYVFSWKLLLESPGEYTNLLYPIHNAEQYQKAYAAGAVSPTDEPEIRAIDDHTLRVTLDRPVTYFLDLMAFPTFYPRHAASMEKFRQTVGNSVNYDNRYTRPPDVVTNGPFKLVRWDFKKSLYLERNPFYWDDANVKLTAIENIVNENSLSQLLQFDAGAADWVCDVSPDLAADLRDKRPKDLQTCTAFGTAFLTLYCRPNFDPAVMNGAKNPLADVRVRQALAMAIDKRFITEKITRNGEAVASTYIPPGTLAGYSSLPGLAYDVAAAKKLLAEAGYPDGRGFPQLPILYNTENTVRAKFSQYLSQQWRQNLGIDVRIEGLEGKIFKDRVSKKQYAIATVAWFGDYPDVSTFTDKYISNSLQNDSAWINPAFDALVTSAANEASAQKRLATLQQAEHLINTEMPIIPLYHYVNATLVAPGVKGVDVNARGLVDWKRISLGSDQ